MKNAIEIKNLTKTFDGFMLNDVSFNVPCGSIVGFIGRNGAGKTTAIKLILGLLNKDSGEIKVFDKEIDSFSNTQIKESIGVVLDSSSFTDYLTANGVNAVFKNIYKTWDSDKFFSFMQKFNLPLKKEIKSFSKGMKTKLSIACALSHNSKLLILDEATSGLDPIVREEILDIFLDYIQDEEKSILVSSHILSDLEKICDYITFIDNGQIILSKEKDVLLDEYALLTCSKEDLKSIDKSAIIKTKENQFSTRSLVIKSIVSKNLALDSTTLEDIMIFASQEV